MTYRDLYRAAYIAALAAGWGRVASSNVAAEYADTYDGLDAPAVTEFLASWRTPVGGGTRG